MNYSSYVYYVINDEDMKPNRKEKDPEIKSTTLEAIGMLVFLPCSGCYSWYLVEKMFLNNQWI